MDTVVEANIKRYLENLGLMFSLVKSHYEGQRDADSIIDLLKMQHSSNQSLLSDLGYTPDETIKIRRLNGQVRELEAKLGERDDINFEVIAHYVGLKEKQLNELLEARGLWVNVKLQASGYLQCEIKFYSQGEKHSSSLMYYKNEEELNKANVKHAERLAKFKSEFDTSLTESSGSRESNYLLYTDRNIKTINDLCYEFFGSEVERPEFELRTDEGNVFLERVKFTMTCTNSGRNLKMAFEDR